MHNDGGDAGWAVAEGNRMDKEAALEGTYDMGISIYRIMGVWDLCPHDRIRELTYMVVLYSYKHRVLISNRDQHLLYLNLLLHSRIDCV